jgi:hypothetical protein
MSEENNGNAAPIEAAPEETNEEVVETVEDIEQDDAQEGQPGQQEKQAQTKEQKALEKAIKAFEIKVNGKAKKVELDLNDEASIKKYLEKAEGAQEKFQEAALYRKQAEQLVEMLQKDPLSILRNPALGIDVKKLAEMVLDEQMAEAQLTPEQKRIKELEAALTEREKKEKETREAKEAEEKQRLTREMYAKAEQDMMTALDSSSIGASPYAVRRVADMMSALIEEGYENVEIKDIMPFAERVILQELGGHIQKHREPSKLEKLLGKDVLKEYRKSKISQVKKTPNTNTVETGKKSADLKKEEPKKIKMSDWGSPW